MNERQVVWRKVFLWRRRLQFIEKAPGFLPRARNRISGDQFGLDGDVAIGERHRLPEAFNGFRKHSFLPEDASQIDMGDVNVRVEFDGLFQNFNRRVVAAGEIEAPSQRGPVYDRNRIESQGAPDFGQT